VSELRGTTKPFTTLQAAVARNMNESLKVRFLQGKHCTAAQKQQLLFGEHAQLQAHG
jgi:pyruvate dehydrogenase E2 component (dihydrolipoamide acetyltransferase)